MAGGRRRPYGWGPGSATTDFALKLLARPSSQHRIVWIASEVIGMGEMPPTESTSETAGFVCESWLGGVLRHYRRAAA